MLKFNRQIKQAVSHHLIYKKGETGCVNNPRYWAERHGYSYTEIRVATWWTSKVDDAINNSEFAKKKARYAHFADAPSTDQGFAPEGAGSVKSGDSVCTSEEVGRCDRVMYFARFLETKRLTETVPAIQSIVNEIDCHFNRKASVRSMM